MKKYIPIGVVSFTVMIAFSFSFIQTPTLYIFPKLSFFPEMPLPMEYQTTIEGVNLGRYLFYDKILSRDSTVSCATCHRLEAAFSDSPKQFSFGIKGQKQKRNTPALFNLAWNKAFFWDGRASTIEEQILFPIKAHDEMNLDWKTATERIQNSDFYRKLFFQTYNTSTIDSTLITYSIAQFERTLISNNSKYDKVLRREAFLSPEEYQGFVLMNDQVKGNCMHCHITDANALGTTGKFSNNGLDSVYSTNNYKDKGLGGITGKDDDIGLFKIPSLRNIALTAPYMHDGRFNTLIEVLDFYSEDFHNSINIDSKMMFNNKQNRKLTTDEKQKIIAFLHTLTDTSFVNNTSHSNPFNK